ncbi:hypothetical protein DMUE_1358 [Dictyocoela muelleri]|nr:hypothetical protein DMUE_1358 [Dictyocoela muelleri]
MVNPVNTPAIETQKSSLIKPNDVNRNKNELKLTIKIEENQLKKEEIATEEIATEEIVSEEIATEEIATEEIVSEEIATEEIVSEEGGEPTIKTDDEEDIKFEEEDIKFDEEQFNKSGKKEVNKKENVTVNISEWVQLDNVYEGSLIKTEQVEKSDKVLVIESEEIQQNKTDVEIRESNLSEIEDKKLKN